MARRDLGRALRRNLADHGIRTTLGKIARSVAMPVAGQTTYRVYGLDLAAASVPPIEDDGIEFRFLKESDVGPIYQAEDMEEWLRGRLRAKIATGSLCLAAMDGDRLAGFNLVSTGRIEVPSIKRSLTFGQNHAWSEQISTHRDWRRRGIASRLRFVMIEELRRRGVRWFSGGALRSNQASLALARRVGFTDIGEIKHRKLLSKQKWTFTKYGHEDAGFDTQPFHGMDSVSVDELPVQ